MQILDFTPINVYTCMFCPKEFESDIELKIWWFCSNSCRYKFAFAYASQHFPEATREQLFEITKQFARFLK